MVPKNPFYMKNKWNKFEIESIVFLNERQIEAFRKHNTFRSIINNPDVNLEEDI